MREILKEPYGKTLEVQFEGHSTQFLKFVGLLLTVVLPAAVVSDTQVIVVCDPAWLALLLASF